MEHEYPPAELLKSPYLDVGLADEDSKFIYIDNKKRRRGRLELCFVEIGSVVCAGAGIGTVRGFIKGKELAKAHPAKLHRTIMINQIIKSSHLGNTVGVLALLFSGTGILMGMIRGTEDSLNHVVAGTASGMLFQSSGGKNKIMAGGMTGFCFGCLLALWNVRDSLKNYLAPSHPPKIQMSSIFEEIDDNKQS